MKRIRIAAAAFAAAAFATSGTASAGPIDLYPHTIDLTSVACAPLGDFISCSTPYLNLVNGLSVNLTTPTGYVQNASEGAIQNALVIGTGSGNAYQENAGGAPQNADIGPGIDRAYPMFNSNQATSYSTVTASNANGDTPPNPPSLNAPIGDSANAWDISLSSLISALTINGDRKSMFIFFDHNQEGSDVDQSIDIWALVVVRDVDGILPDMVFELNPSMVGPTNFTSTKTYDDYIGNATSNPAPADFVQSFATLCVDNATLLSVGPPNTAESQSDCPAGSTFINNNLGTNAAEFVNFIPELDAALEDLLLAGYDTVGVRFDVARNNDGFENIFVLAGDLQLTVPEPSALASLGFGLIAAGGLALAARRRRI